MYAIEMTLATVKTLKETNHFIFVKMPSALWRFFNPEKKAGREKEFISSNILFIFAVNAVFCTILFLSASFISESLVNGVVLG